MSPLDADMIDVNDKNRLRAMTNLAINPRTKRKFQPLQRCIDTKRVATCSTCGIVRFAAGFVLKPERQPCNSEAMPESKVQYFSSESTISGCDTSCGKSAVGTSEIGKVAVAAARVQFLSIRHRKVTVAAARCVFCTFWRVQEARDSRDLGAIWEAFGSRLGGFWDREEQKYHG